MVFWSVLTPVYLAFRYKKVNFQNVLFVTSVRKGFGNIYRISSLRSKKSRENNTYAHFSSNNSSNIRIQ
jgi:hypothetical protein